MNRYVRYILLSLTLGLMAPHVCNAETIDPEYFSQEPSATISNGQPYIGPLDKASAIVDKGHEALHYIGRDAVVNSLNYLSKSVNNLVAKGVTLNFGPHKIIPQLGFCAVGILASACGLGVITHTALQKKQKNSTRKYLAGAGMLTLGIASLATSCLFSWRDSAVSPELDPAPLHDYLAHLHQTLLLPTDHPQA